MLFDGANSAVLLQEAQTRREFRIALPQTGQFSDLKPHEKVLFSFDPSRAVCFPARAGAAGQDASGARRRWHGALALGLLLAPALLWLGALIILPHVDLAMLSFRERVGPAPVRRQPGAVQDLLRRTPVLACVRAHGGDVRASPPC